MEPTADADTRYQPFLPNYLFRLMQVFKIVPTVQQYDWGKLGSSSKVAVFAQSAGLSNFHVDEAKPYAEVCAFVMPSLTLS